MTERLAKAMAWLDMLQAHGIMARLVGLHPDMTEAYRVSLLAAKQDIANIRKAEEVEALAKR